MKVSDFVGELLEFFVYSGQLIKPPLKVRLSPPDIWCLKLTLGLSHKEPNSVVAVVPNKWIMGDDNAVHVDFLKLFYEPAEVARQFFRDSAVRKNSLHDCDFPGNVHVCSQDCRL